MSRISKILAEINECRTNPSRYSLKISRLLRFYRGKTFIRPGCDAIETEEGINNVLACINYLRSTNPVSELELNTSLTLAAQLHADDIGPSGRMSHIGEDGSEPCDRVEKFCKWSGHLGENIDYANADPEDIVISLLIDDGVLARGQRLNIMKNHHFYTGIGFGYHAKYQYVCVIVFAEVVVSKPSVISSARKIQKSEYVKVKAITPEDTRKASKKESFVIKSKEAYEYNSSEFTEDEIIEIREFFDKVDRESTGNASVSNIKEILKQSKPEASSVFKILKSLDLGTLESIEFGELLTVIAEKKIIQVEENSEKIIKVSGDLVNDAKNIFDLLDPDRSGCIDVGTIRQVIESNERFRFNSTVLEIIYAIENSQHSKLSFNQFVDIFSTLQESQIFSQDKTRTKVPKSLMVSYEIQRQQSESNDFDPAEYAKSGITVEQVLEIKNAFDLFDVKKKGAIDTADLKAAMEDQGFKRKNPSVYGLVCELDVKGKASIKFQEFFYMLTERYVEKDAEAEIKYFFDLFDRDGKGYIEVKNLNNAIRELGESFEEYDILELIRKSDLDGDGKVTFSDFLKVMSKAL